MTEVVLQNKTATHNLFFSFLNPFYFRKTGFQIFFKLFHDIHNRKTVLGEEGFPTSIGLCYSLDLRNFEN